MEEEIRQIKKQLRMAMNGVVASSMRQKGVDYHVNFGLTAPLIKRIADMHAKRRELAEHLWDESVRESKILATMLYPEDEFSETVARKWFDTLEQPEIADQLCYNLAGKQPYATTLALRYTDAPTSIQRYAGFQLLTRALLNKTDLTPEQREKLTNDVLTLFLSDEALYIKAAALNCLKRAMRQHPDAARQITDIADKVLHSLPANDTIRNLADELNAERKWLEESIF